MIMIMIGNHDITQYAQAISYFRFKQAMLATFTVFGKLKQDYIAADKAIDEAIKDDDNSSSLINLKKLIDEHLSKGSLINNNAISPSIQNASHPPQS